MNMKKALSLLTAAALSISSFAALTVTASADTPDYGTKTSGEFDSKTFNVGADSIIYGGLSNSTGNGSVDTYGSDPSLKRTENLSDHEIDGTYIAKLQFQELTSTELSSFDAVDLLVGCGKDRSATVYVGETPVASFSNVNTGDWTKYESLTAELTSTNASGSVTLVITNPAHTNNDFYMGNYVTLKFYNRDNVTTYGSVYTDTSGNKIFGFNGDNSVIQYSKLGTPQNYTVNNNTYSIPDSIQGKDYVAILQMHYVDLSKNNFGKAVICMGNASGQDYSITMKVGDTDIATFTNKSTDSWDPKEQNTVYINNHTAKGYVTLTINHNGKTYAGNYAYVKFIPRTEFSSSGEITKGTTESELSNTGSSYQRFTGNGGNPADAYMTSIDFNSQYAASDLKWCIYKTGENKHAEIPVTGTTFSGGTVYFGLVISGTEAELNSITKVELK